MNYFERDQVMKIFATQFAFDIFWYYVERQIFMHRQGTNNNRFLLLRVPEARSDEMLRALQRCRKHEFKCSRNFFSVCPGNPKQFFKQRKLPNSNQTGKWQLSCWFWGNKLRHRKIFCPKKVFVLDLKESKPTPAQVNRLVWKKIW